MDAAINADQTPTSTMDSGMTLLDVSAPKDALVMPTDVRMQDVETLPSDVGSVDAAVELPDEGTLLDMATPDRPNRSGRHAYGGRCRLLAA